MSDKLYITVNGKKREMNAEEKAQYEKDQAEAQERASVIEAAEREKKEKRESAVNKLKALGLTDEEVEALIP